MADHPPDVAIVGMAALFPGSPDLEAFGTNLRLGVDGITDVPEHRIDPVFFDPSSDALDRFYGDRGGFVDRWARFDPLRHGVVPSAVAAAEPDQLLVLKLAVDALEDGGLRAPELPRETTGVFIGRGGYISAGLARSAQKVREGEQLIRVLRQVLPELEERRLAEVKEAWRRSAGDLAPDQAIGLVPNLAASRTANRLGLQGPALTFDAACASSLIAVEHAVRELRSGRLDAACVGGVHLVHDPTFWSIFCRLGAMSRVGRIRPFDAAADGLLIGEGAGVVWLKRLDDALRDGDRVRAVICGVGSSSDGRGGTLMRPGVEGQALALRRAWRDAGRDPSTVGLIEAHGTATSAGDASELATLAEVFGSVGAGEGRVALGSVKSMIGHTMPAAGIAGLIKATLAVEAGVWLPSLHVRTPHPDLERTRFFVPDEAIPWPSGEGPRRAGVNAFGFGGVNAHVVLEQAPSAERLRSRVAVRPPAVALYSAPTPAALARALLEDRRGRDGGPCRCALRDPTPTRRERAARLAERARPWHGRRGIWLRVSPTDPAGRVALLFPGIEEEMDAGVGGVAGWLDVELPPVLREPAAPLSDLGRRGAQVLGASRVLASALARLGLEPDVVTGHSMGEWSALVASGVIDPSQIDGFIESLSGEHLKVPDVVFGVLGVSRDVVEPFLAQRPDVVLSHDNCSRQVIVCGPEVPVRALLDEVPGVHVVLPFKSGFHSPHFEPFVSRMQPHIDRLPLASARCEAWSACTVGRWPTEPEAVREVLRRILVEPVRFRETVEALYAQGVRTFVQVGRGSLSGFVSDTLGERPHAVIDTATRRDRGEDAFAFAVASLWCEGVQVSVERVPGVWGPSGSMLDLGSGLVDLDDPPRLSVGPSRGNDEPVWPEGPVGEALRRSLDATRGAQQEVAEVWRRVGTPPSAPTTRRTRMRLGVDTHPFLMDHCLFGQPDHVTDPVLRYPVVPMTMNVRMMIEEASALVPDKVAVAIEDVRAWRWLVVAPPVEIELVSEYDGVDRVRVQIPGFAEAVVRMADDYPVPPAPSSRAHRELRPLRVPVADIYPERWMFHGPAYQGIVDLGPTAADGIQGAIVARPAPGATTDNVGQVFGFWGFERLDRDGLGFPSRIRRMAFHGPPPEPGSRLEVSAWIDQVTPSSYRGDIEVRHRGVVWADIAGWENRRFETDEIVFPFLRKPGERGLAEPGPGESFLVRERWRTAASRELLIRRYLDRDGLGAWASVPPLERRRWVLERVTICDAVRAWLWASGQGPVFPIEVQSRRQGDVWRVTTLGDRDVRVAVTVGDGVAVARVAEGQDPEPPGEAALRAVEGTPEEPHEPEERL